MDADKVAKIAVCVAMVFLGTASTFHAAWRNRSWLRSAVCKVFGAAGLRALWQKPTDPLEQRVAAKCSERRVGQAKTTLVFGVCAAVLIESVHLQRLITDRIVISWTQLAPLQVAFAGPMLLGLFPCLVTARTIDAIFSWHILLVAAAIMIHQDTENLMSSEHDATPYRVAFVALSAAFTACMVDLKPWLNVVGMMLIALALSVTHTGGMIEMWSMSLVLAVALCWMGYRLKAGVRLEILAMDCGQQLTAVNTLLNTICDVVVELDEDLRMVSHSKKLSDIMLRRSARSLQGATVQEFMPEEDREKFVQALRGEGEAQAHSDVFHARISDCDATPVSMEFFSASFVGPDARRRHLLGMREFTDIPPLVMRPLQHVPPPQERAARQNWPGTPASAETQELVRSARSEDTASETSSEDAASEAPAVEASGPRPRRETDGTAMLASLLATLMTWHVRYMDEGCCSLHMQVAEAQRVIGGMARCACEDSTAPAHEWQCQRCGIVSDNFRVKGRRKRLEGCLLCKDLELEGTKATAAVAL